MKLRPEKCHLLTREVKYLGKIISAEGYKPDPKDVAAVEVLKIRRPQSIGELRQVLGLVGYHRKFIPAFSQTAKPLYGLLTQSESSPEKGKKQHRQ